MALVVSGSFTGTGQSATFLANARDPSVEGGRFNIDLSGFGTATVVLQRSFDNGSTWNAVKSYSADASEMGEEAEAGVLYRFNCTAYTSGTIAYRLSR